MLVCIIRDLCFRTFHACFGLIPFERSLVSPQPWNMPPTKVPLNWQILELKYIRISGKIQSYTTSLCSSSFGNLYLTCVFICFCIFSVIILNVTGCGSRWAGLPPKMTEYLTRPCVNLVVMYSTLLPPCFYLASTLLPPCWLCIPPCFYLREYAIHPLWPKTLTNLQNCPEGGLNKRLVSMLMPLGQKRLK